MSQPSPEQDNRVLQAFSELLDSQEEFPLNVEGAKTMPYASFVASIDQGAMQIVLRVLRPMPAELPSKTPCKASIGALGEHWKALLAFQGRSGHLHYLFDLPKIMEKAGRREHKRYTFRPMENVNVYVQDSSLPGISAVGQLLDLSTGGLSFRPDRAFRVEDEAGLKMETAIFERGKHFPVIRIDGMPKLDGPIRLNGTVTHVEEKQSILVAFVFGMLDPDEEKNLAQALEIRESMGNQGGAGGPGPSSSPTGGQATADSDNLDDSEAGSAETNAEPDEAALDKTLAQLGNELRPLPPTILRLARRTCSILLVKPSGENCDEIIKSLKIAGFVRVSQCNDLDSHAVHTTQNASAMLVGIEIGGKPEDAVNSFRNIHERLQNRKVPKPIVISDQPEPSLLQTAEDLSLPIGFTSDLSWAEVLDRAIGLLGG